MQFPNRTFVPLSRRVPLDKTRPTDGGAARAVGHLGRSAVGPPVRVVGSALGPVWNVFGVTVDRKSFFFSISFSPSHLGGNREAK